MGTYFSAMLYPSSTILVHQLWNINECKIHQKITLKNTSNPVELLVDIPSYLCNLLEYKLKNALELTKKGAKKKRSSLPRVKKLI